jgi:hypothetical protein
VVEVQCGLLCLGFALTIERVCMHPLNENLSEQFELFCIIFFVIHLSWMCSEGACNLGVIKHVNLGLTKHVRPEITNYVYQFILSFLFF